MTGQTSLRAMNYVASASHAESNRFCVLLRRFAFRMLAEPGLRRSVAVFAAHTLCDFEWSAAALRRGVERVARQTFRRLFRFRAKFQNAGHAFADVARERLIRARVLILQNPRGIFILKDAAFRNRFHAAVAGGGGTRSGTNVFGFGPFRILRVRGGRETGARKAESER